MIGDSCNDKETFSPEIIEGGLVSNVLGNSTARKSHMVRRAQNKDGLHYTVVYINHL